MSEHIRGVMLEGLSGSGKTTTLLALKKLLAADTESERSIIVLAEHYSQVLNSVNGKFVMMNREEHCKLLSKRIEMLEQLNEYARSLGSFSRRSRGLFVIFERFYLNHIVSFHDAQSDEMLALADRINDLGLKEILLVASNESHEKRKSPLKPSDLPGLSADQLARLNDWKTEQSSYLKAAEQSKIPTLVLHTDSLDWEGFAKQIVGFTDYEVPND